MPAVRRGARWSAIALVLLAAVPGSGPARAVEGDLSVDVHWFDAVQSADHATVRVTETYFFNNSGSAEFSGNLSFRIPAGAQVASKACGDDADTIARLAGAAGTHCFPLEDLGGGTRQGSPFNGTPMSFYGQRDVLTVRANSSLGDAAVLAFNVTVGAGPAGGAVLPPPTPGLHLGANRTEIGGLTPSVGGVPTNLTYEGNLTVRNNRTVAAAVNLTVDLGGSWTATILEGNATPSFPIRLAANETRELVVRVTAPNYLLKVQVDYTLRMASAGDRRWSLPVEYLYPVGNAQYFLFLVRTDNATGGASQAGSFVLAHEGPTWQDAMDRWWFFFIAQDLPAGARVDFEVFTMGGADFTLLAAALLAVVAAAALLTYVVRRRRKAGEVEATGAEPTGDVGVTTKAAKPATPPAGTEAARSREALARVERDHELGRLPDDTYERLRAKYEESAAGTPASGELAELEERKERILRAIRTLHAERDAGSLDADVARELDARYREEAVSILKRMDGLKK